MISDNDMTKLKATLKKQKQQESMTLQKRQERKDADQIRKKMNSKKNHPRRGWHRTI